MTSYAYPQELHKIDPSVTVIQQACPRLVPMIEAGELGNIDDVVRTYMDQLLEQDARIDTVLLGCTHYALIESTMREIAPARIRVAVTGSDCRGKACGLSGKASGVWEFDGFVGCSNVPDDRLFRSHENAGHAVLRGTNRDGDDRDRRRLRIKGEVVSLTRPAGAGPGSLSAVGVFPIPSDLQCSHRRPQEGQMLPEAQ